MHRALVLFVLLSCGKTPPLSSLDAPLRPDAGSTAPVAFPEDAAVEDGSYADAPSGVSDAAVLMDARVDARVDALPVIVPDAATTTDAALSKATCVATVTLGSAGGNGNAIWTCTGSQLANWHLKIDSRDGVLVDELNGVPCPGGGAFISFGYKTTFEPFISLNRLELADGTFVPCSAP